MSLRAEISVFDILTIQEILLCRETEVEPFVGEVNFPENYPVALEIESGAAENSDEKNHDTARRSLLEKVRETQTTGRLAIDVASKTSCGAATVGDVSVRDGDSLFMPRESQTVTVIGEVQFPTSHIFKPGFSRNDYVDLSGGLTARVDNKRIYVVQANGSVASSRKSLFFRNRNANDIRPGDTIVVPIKADPLSPLTLWTSVTSIIYSIGVAVAAVGSFNR